MTDLHLNPLAILAAAGSAFVLGAIWVLTGAVL